MNEQLLKRSHGYCIVGKVSEEYNSSLALSGESLKLPDSLPRVNEIITRVNVTGFLSSTPGHMSKRPQSDAQKFICFSFLYALAYAIWPTAAPGCP
jgi:hypothetical protein